MMIKSKKTTIFLVDDDAVYLKFLEIQFLEHSNFNIESFSTGELCLKNLSQNPSAIILDYYLNGIDKNAMNGIAILDKIKAFNPEIPVVMLSAQDKIEVAINCMHHKAIDYVVKSETAFVRLQKIIAAVLSYNKLKKELKWYMDRLS